MNEIRRARAVLAFTSMLACGAPPRAQSPSTLDGGACPANLGSPPFEKPTASHILLAYFYGLDPAGREFAGSVYEKIDIELRRFEEEELPKMLVHVPGNSVEFKRLHCFVKNHEDAD